MKSARNIILSVDEMKILSDGYQEDIKAINKDKTLFPFGKSEKAKTRKALYEAEQEKAEKMWVNAWAAFRTEAKAHGESTTIQDRSAVMQTIMAVGDNMNKDMLEAVLEPIKRDVSALQLARPLIEKQGLEDVFAETNAGRYLTAASRLESFAKAAEVEGKELVKDTDGLRFGIRKGIMTQFLQAAEEQYNILKELEG